LTSGVGWVHGWMDGWRSLTSGVGQMTEFNIQSWIWMEEFDISSWIDGGVKIWNLKLDLDFGTWKGYCAG
jgi:hypothetical protein